MSLEVWMNKGKISHVNQMFPKFRLFTLGDMCYLNKLSTDGR